jgi:hypothetical protein
VSTSTTPLLLGCQPAASSAARKLDSVGSMAAQSIHHTRVPDFRTPLAKALSSADLPTPATP